MKRGHTFDSTGWSHLPVLEGSDVIYMVRGEVQVSFLQFIYGADRGTGPAPQIAAAQWMTSWSA